VASRKTLILIAAVLVGAIAAFGTLNYVKGVEQASAAQDETVQVLIARQPIAKGTRADDAFASGRLVAATRRRVDVPASPVRRNAEIEGQVAAVELGGGEIITTSMFVGATDLSGSKSASLEKGNVAITVQFDPTSAALVQPGDSINILTRTCAPGAGGADGACPLVTNGLNTSGSVVVAKPSTYLFQAVKVIAVDQSLVVPAAAPAAAGADGAAAPAPAQAAAPSGRVTVQLPPDQAALLASVRDADLFLTLNRADYEPRPIPVQSGLPALPGQLGGTTSASNPSGK